MELWIAIRGSYEDQWPVGVATSEAKARELLNASITDPDDSGLGAVVGPFQTDERGCGCLDRPGLCQIHQAPWSG